MRAVVVGAVESSRIAIEAIGEADGWSLPLVVTLPASLAHRHSDFVDLGEASARAGARLLGVADINARDALDTLAAVRPDYVFVIGWSQICRSAFMEIARLGTIGYHPAPLPRMRGRAVIPWTILAKEPISASTLFWIDDGVDSGPILEQRFFHVLPDETAQGLYQRHVAALGDIMRSALVALAEGTARREPQDERFATWVARRTAECGRIDWSLPAEAVERLVRAVGRPYSGARTRMASRDHDLIVWKARKGSDFRHLAQPGQVVARAAGAISVQCGDHSTLDILEWESSDGRPPAMHMILGDRGR